MSSYRSLLRAAVRYFALHEIEELSEIVPWLRDEAENAWKAMWWRHRSPLLVAGALVDASDRGEVTLPAFWRERCLRLLQAGAQRFALLSAVAEQLSRTLECSLVRLKGMWLTEFVYPHVRGCPTRLFGDIDLAIPPEALYSAHHALTRSSSEPQFHPEPWEYVYRLESPEPTWEGLPMLEDERPVPEELLRWGNHSIFVELHTGSLELMRFVSKPYLIVDEKDTAAHGVHLFLHLLNHLFWHPYGFVDVALVLRHPSLDQKRFFALVREYGLDRLGATTIGVVGRCFGEDVVPDFCRPWKESSLYRRVRAFAPMTAAIEPIPTLWTGARLAWEASPTWQGRKFVGIRTSQEIINRLVPPETRVRGWIRLIKRRWKSRKKISPL